jgi:phosphoglucosamine mutase
MKLFGTAGIRGIFNRDITSTLALQLSLAIAKGAERGRVATARDGRLGAPPIKYALESGFLSAGWGVLDVDLSPAPVLAFTTREYKCDYGVMVTASHNPPEYIGVKVFDETGMELPEVEEAVVERRIEESDFPGMVWSGAGHRIQAREVWMDYVETLLDRVSKGDRMLRVLVDCSNGPVTPVTSEILSRMGHIVILYNSNLDGRFPGRPPEPTEENLRGTARVVRELGVDVGIAFDGDGDRISVINERGEVVSMHTTAATYVKHRLGEEGKRDVAVSIDSSKALDDVVKEFGGKIHLSRLGKTFVRVRKQRALIGSEPWKIMDAKWGNWEDGIFAAAKLLSWLSNTEMKASEFFHQVPEYPHFRRSYGTRDRKEAEEILDRIVEGMEAKAQDIVTMDGVRMAFDEKTWLLVRPSGTESKVRIYAEADTVEELNEIVGEALQLGSLSD